VRKAGNNLRIVAQLIDASSDSHLWAEKYSGTLDDVFDIQEKVSRSIADSLRIKLSPHEDQQITVKPIENVQAYEYYLKAKYEISQYTGDSLIRAKQLLENGLAISGDDALLYATLGYVKNSLFDAGIVTDDTILDEAELDAKKSLSIDPDLAQGYFLLALLERGRGNLMKGYTFIKKAYENDPADSTILVYTASFLGVYAGRPLLAKPLLEKLVKNDPLNPMNYVLMGFNYYAFGNLEKAIELVHKASILDPELPWSKYWHAVFHAIENKSEESLLLLDQASKLQHLPEIHINLLSFYKAALKGDNKSALSVVTEDTKNYIWNDPDITGFFPGWYALTGQIEDSLKLFEHAVNRGWINYPLFNEYDPLLENIRGEDRFKKLMEKVKYEWEHFEV
jgi:tetratricopeptide (TPR) repeat protein